MKLRSSYLLGAALGAFALGCGSGAPTSADCFDRLAGQAQHRFLAGETYSLPTAKPGASCGGAWTLSSGPAANANQVVVAADGAARFSPVVPGAYTFKSGAVTETLTVVDAAEAPFHNLNYYPAQSLARVGDELWVADALTPQVTRLDRTTLAPLGQIAAGAWPVAVAWRPAAPFAVVAQRGSDTLGLVDVAAKRLVDAVWVGDEPSNVVLAADGHQAFVALATEGRVAVVDLDKRARIASIDVGPDPVGLALSPDGKLLAVASHRSGQSSRYPYGTDPVSEQRDVTLIDTATLAVVRTIAEVGTTLGDLLWAPDGARLYVAGLSNDTEAPLGKATSKSFVQEVVALDPKTGQRLAAADLSRQTTSSGNAVSLRGLALAGGALWVTAEGSNLTLRLDPGTLAELSRVTTGGRPRAILADGPTVYVHGPQGFQVTSLDAQTGNPVAVQKGIAPDPRPEPVARGQAYFTGAGRSYGATWSCNSCHADGLTDTLVWKAGPVADWATVRPLVWLEGTNPLGWAGYLSSVRNYAYTVSANVGIRPTTAEAEGLWAYIASLMPPPAATGNTARDGALSPQGQRGKALFDGKAACAGCHGGPLTTNRLQLDPGISPGVTQVPPLVGVYRYGVWLKHGQARTLDAAVKAAADYAKVTLAAGELADVTEYVRELTGRDFFLLSSAPADRDAEVAADAAVTLTFSAPVFDDPQNLAHLRLLDAKGQAVPTSVTAKGRLVTLTPAQPLTPGAAYAVAGDAALESFDERRAEPVSFGFKVAGAPSLKLDGDYLWTVKAPFLDVTAGKFDPIKTVDVVVAVHVTSSATGGTLHLDYTQGLSLDLPVVIDGAKLVTPPLPMPFGPTAFTDTTGIQGALVDDDHDGVGDHVTGTMTMQGPGFVLAGVAFTLARPPPAGTCTEGATGMPLVTVTHDPMGHALIDWGTDPVLAAYVTDPQATLPLGPGKVTGGATYWAVQTSSFPTGFAGPLTYGVVPMGAMDTTVASGGATPAPPLVAGQCYKVSVVTTKFDTGAVVLKW